MYLVIQAVCDASKFAKDVVKKLAKRREVFLGRDYFFVRNEPRPNWNRGVGKFTVNTEGCGEPVDFQAILTVDSVDKPDEYVMPFATRDGMFKPLGPFNRPKDEKAVHRYKFGNRLDQEDGKPAVYLPIYVVRVWRNGKAQIAKYTLVRDSIRATENGHQVQIECEVLYREEGLHMDEFIIKAGMDPMLQPLAKFMLHGLKSFSQSNDNVESVPTEKAKKVTA